MLKLDTDIFSSSLLQELLSDRKVTWLKGKVQRRMLPSKSIVCSWLSSLILTQIHIQVYSFSTKQSFNFNWFIILQARFSSNRSTHHHMVNFQGTSICMLLKICWNGRTFLKKNLIKKRSFLTLNQPAASKKVIKSNKICYQRLLFRGAKWIYGNRCLKA